VLDIVTSEATHAELARLAVAAGIPVICQKPLAPTYEEAAGMVAAAAAAGVPLLVHENFRWQAPIRAVRAVLDSGAVGRPFRAWLDFSSAFPVFDNQPFLREAERFILLDVGSHVLDVARFLMGDGLRVACTTASVTPGICGEDVATVLVDHGAGTSSVVTLSYASRLEHARFPETSVRIEAERGSIELAPGHVVRVTTAEGTTASRHAPPPYPWADRAYDLVHASIVPCHANLAGALRGGPPAETSGEDNLRTLALVFGAYAAAERGETVDTAPPRAEEAAA
jgi:predicted dehydrogenase